MSFILVGLASASSCSEVVKRITEGSCSDSLLYDFNEGS